MVTLLYNYSSSHEQLNEWFSVNCAVDFVMNCSPYSNHAFKTTDSMAINICRASFVVTYQKMDKFHTTIPTWQMPHYFTAILATCSYGCVKFIAIYSMAILVCALSASNVITIKYIYSI